MYCPNCAAQVDGMKFCRKCGANVSLVPQALTGQLPTAPPAEPLIGLVYDRRGRRRHNRPLSMESAGKEFFGGLGFLFLSLAIWQFFPGGKWWWFWMLIPAFGAMGKGIGQYLSLREQPRQFAPPPSYNVPVPMPPASPQPQLPVPTTSELKLPEQAVGAPQSITEHTTRHLDAAPRRESERT
ncbi:MAG: zinc ribbon domain-containing protein [Acidobacteria bacterium]|nr:zinc ribbon domain-containing protein [Acidobacteriota bacterium]MBI3424904.1 zinc ribbon domain-containing protein [Acidobacteriota bacterium]